MTDRTLSDVPLVVRIYAALTFACGLALVYVAAGLTDTHANGMFIFVFLPGLLLVALCPHIWSGRRWAMILALAVAIALELMAVANDPGIWWLLLAMPVVFAALTATGLARTPGGSYRVIERRVEDEVYAAAVYLYALLLAFLAPLDLTRIFGRADVTLYALGLGLVLGWLSVAIARGHVGAMLAAFAPLLLHGLAICWFVPDLAHSAPYLAASAAALVLTVVCLIARRRSKATVID
jgi:hypothetical protein